MLNAIERAAQVMGSQAALARALNIQPPTVNQWVKGDRPVPLEQCVPIERLTSGAVTCEELRPDKAADFAYLRERGTLFPMASATPTTHQPATAGAA